MPAVARVLDDVTLYSVGPSTSIDAPGRILDERELTPHERLHLAIAELGRTIRVHVEPYVERILVRLDRVARRLM